MSRTREPNAVRKEAPSATVLPTRTEDSAEPVASDLEPVSIPANSIAPRARPKAPKILLALTVASVLGGATYLFLTRGLETTNDAFVEGHVASVAARVQAQVLEVLVKDNQVVEAGAPLVRLDPRDFEARLQAATADHNAAKANLALAETNLVLAQKNAVATLRQARGGITQARALTVSSTAAISQANAAIASAESRLQLVKLEQQRAAQLQAEGALSQAVLDDKNAQLDQADFAVAEAKAHRDGLNANLGHAEGAVETANGQLLMAESGPVQVEAARAQVGVAQARLEQTAAALAQAKLNLSYTTITATFRGVISRRTVEPGQMVDPSRPLLSLTSLDDLWIVANYKEDQITHMRRGQPVAISVDAFPRARLSGRVDSLAGATGARFSLLPPDNASGNFTKVVQRVPVLIHVNQTPAGVTLRPGLSTNVTVNVK
jgi:membrane fusion protein (multidrug efflux system)